MRNNKLSSLRFSGKLKLGEPFKCKTLTVMRFSIWKLERPFED
jgi:hypothetical protein